MTNESVRPSLQPPSLPADYFDEAIYSEVASPTNRTDADRRDDLVVVSIWLFMLLYALISNVLIIIGICRSTTMRSATSYWFIISLAVCDIVMTGISLVHLVPATAFHDSYVEFFSWRNIIMIFLYDLFWYTAVLQLGLMAGNRFVSIVYPMEYKWLFSRRRSIYILIFGYVLGLLVSLPTLFPCCHTLWDSDYYITVYYNTDTWYKYVDMGVNSFSLIMMILSYAVIIYKVRESGRAMAKYQLTIRTRQQAQLMNMNGLVTNANGCTRLCSVRPPRSQVSKKEMRLFIQFFVVSLVFLLTWTTWQWLPNMSESKWAYFVMTSLFFINNSVNPTVYLLFNTQLRRELHYLLCRHHAISMAQQRRKRTNMSRHPHNNNNTLFNNNNNPLNGRLSLGGFSCAGDEMSRAEVTRGGRSSLSSTTSTQDDARQRRCLIENRALLDRTTMTSV